MIAGVIAAISLVALFWNDDYRPGVYRVALYVAAISYFAVAGRHKLVFSPAEEFAMSHGAFGHPEREALGAHRGGRVRRRRAGSPPAAPVPSGIQG